MTDVSQLSDAELFAALPPSPERFTAQYAPVAARVGQKLNVDPSILLGQWGHETGWGKSVIPGTNNLGNIKGPGVAATDNMNGSRDQYAKYATTDEFGDAYANLIQKNYPGAVGAGKDVSKFAAALKGYAEDPAYAQRLASAKRSVPETLIPSAASQMSNEDLAKAAGVDLPTSQDAPQQAPAAQPAVAPPGPAASLQPSIMGRLGTGIGDFAGGAARAITSGMGAVGDFVAPNSDFTKGAHRAVTQMDAQKVANDAAFKAKQQAAGQDTTGTDWVRVGGQMIPAFLVPGGATTGAGRLIAGAAGGALGNVAMTQPGESYGNSALAGAGVGLVGAGLAAGVGKVLKGANVSPNAQSLIDQGVTPTPGDVMGGVAKSMEEKASSWPIVGDAIKSAKQASIQDMNTALYKQVLAPVGEQAPRGVGREAVEAIGDRLGDRYEALLPQVTFQVDNGFVNDMAQVSQQVATLPADVQGRFAHTLDRNFFQKLSQGQMTGEELQKANSMLTQEAKNFGSSSDPFHRDMASAVRDTQAAIRGALMRANPAQAQELQQINTAYSRYAILRNAAQRVNNPENPIAPGQLQAAVKQADKSVGKGNFAKGTANMQGLSDPSMAVLGSKYPDSGTAGRMMFGNGVLGGLAATNPLTAAAGLGLTGLYGTDIGRKTMLAALARRPEFARLLGNGAQSIAPRVGAALGTAYGANK